jgi:hypothetical protein
MPTNVTADYKKAEDAFRRARDPGERLACLKEMLRAVPKHKGTEHLQADIKTRIKQLTEELAGPRKGGRTGTSQTVRPEGAAQVALVGLPNAGKSRLHDRLTGSHAGAGPRPFAPLPGMLAFEDIRFQLVDLPPVSTEFMEPWLPNALRNADAALLVVDLSDPACVDHVPAVLRRLRECRIELVEYWPRPIGGVLPPPAPKPSDEVPPDPFALRLPTLLLANKSDLDPDPDEVRVLEELLGVRFPALAVSAKTGEGCDEIAPALFEGLAIVRVYTKAPGREADRDRPFTVRAGDTVRDVARLVHKDIAEGLRHARVWGSSGQFDGQQVGPDHPVADGDVVELHAR